MWKFYTSPKNYDWQWTLFIIWCTCIAIFIVLPQDLQALHWLACMVHISLNTEAPCQHLYSSCSSELQHRELLWPVWQLVLGIVSSKTMSWSQRKSRRINISDRVRSANYHETVRMFHYDKLKFLCYFPVWELSECLISIMLRVPVLVSLSPPSYWLWLVFFTNKLSFL